MRVRVSSPPNALLYWCILVSSFLCFINTGINLSYNISTQQTREPPTTQSLSLPRSSAADIVLAHCKKNISWLEEAVPELLFSGLKIGKIHVYSMCGIDAKRYLGSKFHKENSVEVSKLPNRGRNDMAFTHHIVSNFNRLKEIEFVLFLKDSMVDYAIDFLRELRVPFSETATKLKAGDPFVCMQRPDENGTEWHLRRETWKFRLPQYTTAGEMHPDKNYEKSDTTICGFLSETLGEDMFSSMSRNEHIKVCYGGSFGTQTNRIVRVSQDAWKRILHKLQSHENGEAMHYMERTWASLLSHPGNTGVVVAGRSLESHRYVAITDDLGKHYPGMYYLNKRDDKKFVETFVGSNETLMVSDSSVLLVSHELSRTGAPLYLLHMAKVLKKEGRKVILISPSDGILSKEFRAEGVQVITSELIDFVAYKWPCMESFCPSPIDLILCLVYTEVGVRPAMVLWNTIVWADVLALSSNERYCHNYPQNVWIIHEWAPEGTNYWPEIRTIWSEYRREAVLGSDAMVFVSDKSREQWQEFDGLVPFHTIPGYSEYTDGYVDVLNNVTRTSLNISDDAFVITSVGTIDRRKQQAWAIDAVAELRKKNINAILLMIGSPEPLYFQQNVLPLQQELGEDIIRLIPPQLEVAPYLLLADLHVSSANEESYPLNTLEAMSLSIPVVATRAGGTEEQFPPEAEWMTSAVELGDFVGTVVKAAVLKNLSRYGEILSRTTSKNKIIFEDKTLNLSKSVAHSKLENARCGVLLNCKERSEKACNEGDSLWKWFYDLEREKKLQLNINRGCETNGKFDVNFYRSFYRDLSSLSDDDAHLHFQQHGRNEGRKGCKVCCPGSP